MSRIIFPSISVIAIIVVTIITVFTELQKNNSVAAHALEPPTSLLESSQELTEEEKRRKRNAEAANLPVVEIPHNLVAAYYDIHSYPNAKLLLNNKGLQPLEVRPTLFNLSGDSFQPSSITVPPNSHIFVSLSEWANSAGPGFGQGSLRLFHYGKDLVLGSQVYLEDPTRSLSFEERLAEIDKFDSRRLEAIWLSPRNQAVATIILSNMSNSTITINARLSRKPHNDGNVQTFTLTPHQTRVLDLRNDFIDGNQFANADLVGLSLTHDGLKSALKAHGLIKDAPKGYSNIISFSDPDTAKSNELQGTGLHLGSLGGERLEAIAAVKNVGSTTTVVSAVVPYTRQDGSFGSINAGSLSLTPGEMRFLNMNAAEQAGRQENVQIASLELISSAGNGTIISAVQSVSQSSDQVYRVPMFDPFAQTSSTGGYPFRIEGSSSTFAYIKNTSAENKQYVAMLRYADDQVYDLGMNTITAHSTIQIDVKKLRDNQVPDKSGRLLPLNLDRGQIKWTIRSERFRPDEPARRFDLVGRSEQIDTLEGVSSSYACQNCCDSQIAADLRTSDPLIGEVGHQIQFTAWEQITECNNDPFPWEQLTPEDGGVYFTSTNTEVVTLNTGSGLATIVGSGIADIGAVWYRDIPYLEGAECPGGGGGGGGYFRPDQIPNSAVDVFPAYRPDIYCETCYTATVDIRPLLRRVTAKPKVTIADIGSVELGGAKTISVSIEGAKNTTVSFSLTEANTNNIGAVKFEDGNVVKSITPTTNQAVTESLTIKGTLPTSLNEYEMRVSYTGGNAFLLKKPITVSSVRFVSDGNCSGLDDSISLNTYLNVPQSGTNTVKAKIQPEGGTGTFNLHAPSGITVSPATISNGEETLTISGGTTIGSFELLAMANQATSSAAKLRIEVRKKVEKSVIIHLIAEDNDDVQVGQFGVAGNPTDVCVSSGNNAFRDTIPAGDDIVLSNSPEYIGFGPDGLCETTANSTDTPPPSSSNIPSASDLQLKLNDTFWGKQANVHFTVRRSNKVKEFNFDIDRNGSLSSTENEAGLFGPNVWDGNYDINLYYQGLNIGGAFTNFSSQESFFESGHNGTIEYLAAHEIGHTIEGSQSHSSSPQDLMFPNDLVASPCRITKRDWDLIDATNP